MKKGIHIIADLYDCSIEEVFSSKEDVEKFMDIFLDKIQSTGLTTLHHKIEHFGPSSVTGYILLAESHISFHTWPEYNYMSLDIFACNYSKDNTQAVEDIFKFFSEYFKAKKIDSQKIVRHMQLKN